MQLGGRDILSEVSFRIDRGSFVTLLGPNGAGKTTLVRLALALLRPQTGSVEIGGHPVARLPAHRRAEYLAWLPQHDGTQDAIECLDLVAAARFRFAENRARSLEAARRALARVGMDEYAHRKQPSLSGGEKQRVALAALLAQEAPFLLLDEPASHLDPAQQAEVYRLIGRLWSEGFGILCITHDVNLLHHAVEREPSRGDRLRILGLRAGRLCFDSAYGDPELAGQLSHLFEVPYRRIDVEGRGVFVNRGARPSWSESS